MTITKKPGTSLPYDITPPNENLSNAELKREIIKMFGMIQELGKVVNNQAELISSLMNRLGQTSFRLQKIDEVLQIVRINTRENKDSFQVFVKTLIELGFIDKDIFLLGSQINQSKYLPIDSDGKINSEIILARYNTPSNLPPPQ